MTKILGKLKVLIKGRDATFACFCYIRFSKLGFLVAVREMTVLVWLAGHEMGHLRILLETGSGFD